MAGSDHRRSCNPGARTGRISSGFSRPAHGAAFPRWSWRKTSSNKGRNCRGSTGSRSAHVRGNRTLPPAMVGGLRKPKPQQLVQGIGGKMLAHPWGTFFRRGRQDHNDSFRPIDRYHPCWQTAIFSSLRLKMDVCSRDCLRKPPPLYPSFSAVFSVMGNFWLGTKRSHPFTHRRPWVRESGHDLYL